MRSLFNRIDVKRRAEVVRDLDLAGTANNDYIILVLLSCTIATFGLVLNSAAVIIGAMLIAPLMSPILRCSLALVRGDIDRVWRSITTLLIGVTLAIGLSTLLGLFASVSFSFSADLPSEILGRTRPNLFDLFVALAGGMAAAYALAQPHLSAALPGVAIATALMPPLCTVGIGLSQERMDVSGGAMLLFLSNLVAILFAAGLIFALVGFRPSFDSDRPKKIMSGLSIAGILVLLIGIILTLLTVNIVLEARKDYTIRTLLTEELARTNPNAVLTSFERQNDAEGNIVVVATVQSPVALRLSDVETMQSQLAATLAQAVALKVLVIPITSLDPLHPPTPTPTPTSSPTITPSPTFTPTPTMTTSPTPTEILAPSPTATISPMRVITPTLLLTTTVTLTPNE